MADNDDPKKTSAYKKQDAENESAESDDVRQALGTLSSQLGAFLDEIKSQRDTDNRERQTDRYRQWLVTRIDLGIAFFALLVLALTYGVYSKILTTENTQATIMATQANIMDKQKRITDQLLIENAKAADAAVTAANTARQELQLTENAELARIQPMDIECVNYPPLGPAAKFRIKFRNLGTTQAVNVLVNPFIVSPGNFGAHGMDGIKLDFVGGKSDQYTPYSPIFLTPAEAPGGFDRIFAGKAALFIVMDISYSDILGVFHTNKIAYEYSPGNESNPNPCNFMRGEGIPKL